MKTDLEKKNKIIHFIEKWFVIGIVLFIIVQLTAHTFINILIPKEYRVSDKQAENFSKDYMGHWYNGTFFINMTVSENFDSQEKYIEMNQKQDKNIKNKVCMIVGTTSLFLGLSLLIVAAYKERKKKLLEGNTPNIIIASGILMLIYKLFEEIGLIIEVSYMSKYSKGFLHTARYYPQVHYIFILPVLLILLGLILKQKQIKDMKLSTKNNEKIIKCINYLIVTIGLSFIIYRFGVRIYELVSVILNSNTNIRLPFYYYIMDLPRSFAISTASYTKLVILRIIKDLPIFISSIISIVMFTKILLSYVKGKIISDENKKRYKIIFISLIISSLIFNLLGLVEVRLLNREFLYQYKEAVYTIALRSLTEPLLYGLFLYSFKHYVEIGYILNKTENSVKKN